MVERIIDGEIMEIVKKYVEVILANYKVKAIILFGSYAKGTNHEDSDIDIAIITDDIKCNDIFDEQLNLKKLRRNIDYRIEPHLIEVADYDNVETPFVEEVINTGIKVAQIKNILKLLNAKKDSYDFHNSENHNCFFCVSIRTVPIDMQITLS